MAEVRWTRDLDTALTLSKSEEKPVLLDFFAPN